MAALTEPITMTFKEDVGGWTTFKSYVPDWGISLNNRYYTMRDGLIWEHNIATNETYTPKPLNEAMEVRFKEVVEFTKEIALRVVDRAELVRQKLSINDTILVDIYNETTGEGPFYSRRAYVPDPYLSDDEVEIRLVSDIEGNLNGISTNKDDKLLVTRLFLINKNSVSRNSFYNDGISDSRIEFIINTEPSTIKEFKTMGYEGLGKWDFEIYTDLESQIINEDAIPKVYNSTTAAGFVNKDDLVRREGKFFGNIAGDNRGNPNKDPRRIDYSRITVQGIGKARPMSNAGSDNSRLSLNNNSRGAVVNVPKSVKSGYSLFFFENLDSLDSDSNDFSTDLKYAGEIVSTTGNEIFYSKGLTGLDIPENCYLLYSSDNSIEKSGARGAYAHVIMTNDDEVHAEVFSVNSEVIPSSR